mmetsp:Transcript_65354/g.181295  ORF Transcript_65354/g.181295 Transcript_65354/m.181295 type:complete len:307 (+) Transcript_65354:41-961(+)
MWSAPVGNSPLARRRRAASSAPAASGGSVRTLDRFILESSARTKDCPESVAVGRNEPATDQEQAIREDEWLSAYASPPVIRHNSCFLHPKGLDDGTGFQPTRPLLMGCRYHDMVKETVYRKGSLDVERIAKHIATARDREAEQTAWSNNRFRKQREMADMWRDMRETFDEIAGRLPQQEARPTMDEAVTSAPVGISESNTLKLDSSTNMMKGAMASSLFEELSAAGLTGLRDTTAGSNYRGLRRTTSQPGPAMGRRRNGTAAMQTSLVRQAPGTRGLPKGFVPAVAMHTGVMMFPKDRWYKVRGPQ